MKQAERPAAGPMGDAVIVAGPTCSGKSALALQVAQALGGVVINADSMQVYRELRVLTARPTPAEEAACPHRLYGIRPAALPGSVAWWRREAIAAMQAAWASRRLPILCGGTGLYLAALTEGLTDIPDPGDAAREAARALLAAIGPAALHQRLCLLDPATASALRPTDSQRLARAWEVLSGTGRGLAAWRQDRPAQDSCARFTAVLLMPPRARLREAIGLRFAAMLRQGAVDEVAALLAQRLPPVLPAMRAHGVPELASYLRGELSLAEAGVRATTAQARYTKRQATWFAHHPLVPSQLEAVPAQIEINQLCIAGIAQESESFVRRIVSFIQSRVDGPGPGRP